jgi:hypothetical protein
MPIPWLSVLKMVPWSDVISNAPKVAEGARKLWAAVSRKETVTPPEETSPALSPEAQAIALLQAQLSDLQQQMLTSSELIKALADQNTELIKRIEVSRIRILWLAGATVVLGIAALIQFLAP